ncbi:hypothetical protein BDV25DRAFT_153965 [Aspergillus avenaceus]|uniref:Uncharacterized protein n=1 Tax=Aspergillus avenaceus TaxID=36643 RepID=A0A5N6TWK3_ASPAV|nr:hypothetical protein BDV25DRAFT_153965 [Aspergillus avenaceus]
MHYYVRVWATVSRDRSKAEGWEEECAIMQQFIQSCRETLEEIPVQLKPFKSKRKVRRPGSYREDISDVDCDVSNSYLFDLPRPLDADRDTPIPTMWIRKHVLRQLERLKKEFAI